jgi:HSP20 family protein
VAMIGSLDRPGPEQPRITESPSPTEPRAERHEAVQPKPSRQTINCSESRLSLYDSQHSLLHEHEQTPTPFRYIPRGSLPLSRPRSCSEVRPISNRPPPESSYRSKSRRDDAASVRYVFSLSVLSPNFAASVEICDQPQSHFVTATFELPGLKKEEIGVHLTHEGRLTISGYRRPPPFLENTDPSFVAYPVKEIKYGRFERTINVPAGLEVCPVRGVFQTRCADSTHPGQGHKRVFGRWHALCFMATHRFSSRVSSRTNTSHRHGLNRLGAAYESSLLQ